MADSIITRAKTAALVALAEHGITTDVQELLLSGDGRGKIAPGALDKMLRAAIIAIREPSEAMASRGLEEWQSSTNFGELEPEAADFDLAWKAMIDALLAEGA